MTNLDSKPLILPDVWFQQIKLAGVQLDRPCLYEWHIEDSGYYIGQTSRYFVSMDEYRTNIEDMFNGRPYRAGSPEGFREIHQCLGQAINSQKRIAICLLENIEDARYRNARKRSLIATRRYEAEQGGLPLLNSN